MIQRFVVCLSFLLPSAVFAQAPGPRPIPPAPRPPRALGPIPSTPKSPSLPAPAAADGDFESVLGRVAAIKSRITWQNGDGRTLRYDSWPAPMKARLAEIYRKLSRGDKDLGLKLPQPRNVVKGSRCAHFTSEEAFDVYAAHVAHAIHVEVNHLVPWSLAGRPPVELDIIFASRSYQARILPSQNADYPSGIQPGRDFKEAPENDGLGELNGDPRVGFLFMTGKTSTASASLVGKDEMETLVNLTEWMRDNVGHGSIPADETEGHRWLENRLRAAPGQKVAIANSGCHSASKLMVDLARSVNIPLLHVRSQESDTTDGNFFNRTHSGLIYGRGSRQQRILWHTDEIYAQTGEPPFPIDDHGVLLPPAEAARAYFDARWLTPGELTRFGFVYRPERVVPEKGFGASSRGVYEDRADYGIMAGYWKKKGSSDLKELMRLEKSYTLCGAYLLGLSCNASLTVQLTSDIQRFRGDFLPEEVPKIHTVEEFEARAKAALKAIGGCAAFNAIDAAWHKKRGSNVMR